MSSSKKNGKNSAKCPVSVDKNLMIQGSGEMDLDVSVSDDWLVINKENGTIRARNHHPICPNPPPKTWGQPAMLGRPPSRYDQVSYSNYHTPFANFVSRPPNFVNNNHDDVVVEDSVGHDGQGFKRGGGYDGIRSKTGGCRPRIVIDSTDDDEEKDDTCSGKKSKNVNVVVENSVGRDGQGFKRGGGGDGIRSKTGGCRPRIVLDSTDDEEEKENDDYSGKKSKNVTKSKVPTKAVPQNLASDPWGHPGVVPKPYMSRDYGPSGVMHPAFGNYGWRPTGGVPNPYISGPGPSDIGFGNYGWRATGVVPKPYMSGTHAPSDGVYSGFGSYGWRPAGRGLNFQPATYPPPPSGFGGNSATAEMKKNFEKIGKSVTKVDCYNDAGDVTEDDDTWSDEDMDCDDDVTQKTSSDQIGHPIHGKVGADLQLSRLQKLKHTENTAHGVGYSQTKAARPVVRKDAYGNPCKAKGNAISLGSAEHDHKYLHMMEAKIQKDMQNLCTRDGIVPGGSNPSSGAATCKMNVKKGGQKVEIFSETEASEFDDNEGEGSEFDDEYDDLVSRPVGESVRGTSEKSGKKMEEDCDFRQASKLPKDDKKEWCDKHQKEESGEATDVSAGEHSQMETKKVAELSNAHISSFEDYKNRVMELAKIIKLRITPKHEDDTCVAEREQLMKIHEEKLEMKKRHQEEEQELEKQFAVALKRFMEKKTAANSDIDASSEL